MPEDYSFLPDKEEDDYSFLPDRPTTPVTQPTALSRLSELGQGLLQFGKSVADVINPAPFFTTDLNKIREAEKHKGEIIDQFTAPFTNYYKDFKNPNAEVNLFSDLTGINQNAAKEDYENKNWGALTADFAGPLALGVAGHKLGGSKVKAEIPKVEIPKTEVLKTELPLHETEIPSSALKPNYELVEKAKYRFGPNGPELISKPKYRLKTEEIIDLPDKPPANIGEFEYKDGQYQRKGAITKAEEPVNDLPLSERFLKEESGQFDPTEITRKIRTALDDAQKYKGYIPDPTPQTQGVVGKLFAAINDAKENSLLQEEVLKAEKGQRIKAFQKSYGTGEKGARAAMAELKGEYGKVPTEPLKLNQADTDALFNVIKDSGLGLWERARGITALSKILTGEGVPQRNELALLDRIYGRGFSGVTTELYGGLGAIPGGFKPVSELANFMRSVKTAYDLSAPLRQGITLIHRPEYWKAFAEMNKGLGKETWYKDIMDSIYQKDIFTPATERGESFADIAGLRMTDMFDYGTREEAYGSRLAEIIPGVKHSERAYLGFLNKLRADVFESLINNAEKQGLQPYDNIALAKEIAQFVNNATGRGSLGKLDRYGPLLNNTFFAPRLIASRLKFLNYNTYAKATPFVRQQYLKSLGATVGTGLTVLGLMKLMGAEVSTDKSSSDFLKAKFGNARLDPWGGFQQYIVTLSKTIDEIKSNYMEGNKPKYGSLPASVKFGYYKFSPAVGAAIRLTFGRDPVSGQKLTLTDEMVRNFAPIFIQDVIDILQDNPNAFPTIPLVLYGTGSQVYEPRTTLPK